MSHSWLVLVQRMRGLRSCQGQGQGQEQERVRLCWWMEHHFHQAEEAVDTVAGSSLRTGWHTGRGIQGSRGNHRAVEGGSRDGHRHSEEGGRHSHHAHHRNGQGEGHGDRDPEAHLALYHS